MHSVLFVCTMNICRSPMAMGLLRRAVQQDQADWRIESAGVRALAGYPADRTVMDILREGGIDLAEHFSRPVSRHLVGEFRLTLAMEYGHKEALRAAFPESAGRIHLVSEMIGEKFEIVDPVGGARADYLETARELEYILGQGMDRIRQLSGEGVA